MSARPPDGPFVRGEITDTRIDLRTYNAVLEAVEAMYGGQNRLIRGRNYRGISGNTSASAEPYYAQYIKDATLTGTTTETLDGGDTGARVTDQEIYTWTNQTRNKMTAGLQVTLSTTGVLATLNTYDRTAPNTSTQAAHNHSGSSAGSGGSHSHAIASSGAHTHTTDSQGDHYHSFIYQYTDGPSAGDYHVHGLSCATTNTTGAHTHSIASSGAHTHTTDTHSGHTHTLTIASDGGHAHTTSQTLPVDGFWAYSFTFTLKRMIDAVEEVAGRKVRQVGDCYGVASNLVNGNYWSASGQKEYGMITDECLVEPGEVLSYDLTVSLSIEHRLQLNAAVISPALGDLDQVLTWTVDEPIFRTRRYLQDPVSP